MLLMTYNILEKNINTYDIIRIAIGVGRGLQE